MRVGILGLGSIGLRHAKNAIALGHEVFGFDPDESRQVLLGGYGGIPATRASVLAADYTIIASPTPHHIADLQSIQNPTLVEKPIGDAPIDFDLGLVRAVGYNLRYHDSVKQAKNWIDAGFIGKPLHANFVLAQFNDKPAYLRDGVCLNWSHEIDLCLHLLGPASLLSHVDKNNTVSDLFLEHKNGAVSNIHLNYINKREERYFTILGDIGKIHCVLSPYRHADCWTEDGSIFSYMYHSTFDEDYITEMKAFLNDAIGPGCTAAQGKAVLDICLGTK